MSRRPNIDAAPERGQARRPAHRGLGTLLLLLLATAGCEGGGGPLVRGDRDAPLALAPRQTREVVFVGERRGEPLVAAIAFRTVDRDSLRSREIRGWLARGRRWETFLDERWSGAAVASPWTLVPHGDLRLTAGGEAGVEALRFERDGRSLRLRYGAALARINRSETSRFHLFVGSLAVGGEPTQGLLVELLRLRRPAQEAAGVTLQMILVSGDSLQLVVDRSTVRGESGQDLLWLRDHQGAREWTEVQVIAAGGHPLLDARREIPERWTLSAPEAGIQGELRALGFAAEVGAERAGRREVEVRYTVSGWIERDGVRTPVTGLLRHLAT